MNWPSLQTPYLDIHVDVSAAGDVGKAVGGTQKGGQDVGVSRGAETGRRIRKRPVAQLHYNARALPGGAHGRHDSGKNQRV